VISQQQQAQLNDLAERYSKEILRSAESALAKYDRTGKTRSSLQVTVLKSTDRESPKIVLGLELQSVLFDVKRMSWVKLPPIQNLVQWAEQVNFSGKIPGYKNSAPNLPPWKAKQRITWAIAKDKRKNDTYKRKPWRKVALSEILKALNRETLDAYRKEVELSLANSLSTGTS
jgi:hypothetical protein